MTHKTNGVQDRFGKTMTAIWIIIEYSSRKLIQEGYRRTIWTASAMAISGNRCMGRICDVWRWRCDIREMKNIVYSYNIWRNCTEPNLLKKENRLRMTKKGSVTGAGRGGGRFESSGNWQNETSESIYYNEPNNGKGGQGNQLQHKFCIICVVRRTAGDKGNAIASSMSMHLIELPIREESINEDAVELGHNVRIRGLEGSYYVENEKTVLKLYELIGPNMLRLHLQTPHSLSHHLKYLESDIIMKQRKI